MKAPAEIALGLSTKVCVANFYIYCASHFVAKHVKNFVSETDVSSKSFYGRSMKAPAEMALGLSTKVCVANFYIYCASHFVAKHVKKPIAILKNCS